MKSFSEILEILSSEILWSIGCILFILGLVLTILLVIAGARFGGVELMLAGIGIMLILRKKE